MELLGQRKRASAIRLLVPLAEANPSRAAIWGSLGRAFFEAERWREAAAAFRQASILSPGSELASLGLFHSLWSTGAELEAFEEMRRFLMVAESDEYATLLHDLTVEGRLALRLEPATAA